MRKTVFKGFINGEEFNNVADYNARMQELLEKNVTINASSGTTIEYEEDKPSKIESELYPFMNNEDFYLDRLVVNDKCQCENNLKDAVRTLENSFNHTVNYLEDSSISKEHKKKFLNDVTTIINDIYKDKDSTLEALDKVRKTEKMLIDEFNTLQEEYRNKLNILNEEKFILEQSVPVIETLLDYYQDVENEAITHITENCNCNGCNGNTCKECSNKDIKTEVTEKIPEKTMDFQAVLNSIFGNGDWSLFKHLK